VISIAETHPSHAAGSDVVERLLRHVLHRDVWRCHSCGTMSNLEIHDKRFRSHSGDDSEENLITLCTSCYGESHNNVKAKGQMRDQPESRHDSR
jgi:5-methylcytosine-specific restriction endonuclease McrA